MLHGKKPPEPQKEEPPTKWHTIKQQFRYLIQDRHLSTVETWYNTHAPRRDRDSFREIIKEIQQHAPQPAMDPFQEHKARHMLMLYGEILSPAAREKAQSWVTVVGEEKLEKFRDIFSGIQSTFTPISNQKAAFVYRSPSEPETVHPWNRKKIDWNSQTVRLSGKDPMTGTQRPMTSTPMKRFTKPLKQFDGDSLLKSLGLEGDEGIERLKALREESRFLETQIVDQDTGCRMYRTKAAQKSSILSNTANRVVPSVGARITWSTSTREFFRDHGVRIPERVKPENHPAIAVLTASLGFVVPQPRQPH